MRKIVVANWKMNPSSLKEAQELLSQVKRVAKRTRGGVKVVVCPPFIYLGALGRGDIQLGAQDVFFERRGAFTGEVSPAMLGDIGATHVIVGHSERRRLGEDNVIVNRKIKAALMENLQVIFCIGEAVRDIHGRYFQFLEEQLLVGLKGVSRNALRNLLIAYEPIWAIGKSVEDAAAPEDVHQMSIFIKKILVKRFGKSSALRVPILYGGSVESGNAEAILREGKADGFLVGHTSLDAKEFGEILATASRLR
jgi:triosephosphate isomerase